MSDSSFPLSVTLKAGDSFSSPWIVVYGHAPDEVQGKLEAIANGGLIEATINAANALKAANNAAPLAPQGQEAQPQQAAPQQQSQQQGGGAGRGQQHPEGKQCSQCGTVLEFKTTGGGKKKWQCPQWRWNNGNPNGHDVEWVNG